MTRNSDTTIAHMADEAGCELDPTTPWKTITDLLHTARAVTTLAKTMRKNPADLTTEINKLLQRLDAVDAELAMRRGWPPQIWT